MQAITSLDHLKSFTTSLTTEICRVWEHWNVLKGLHRSSDEYFREMNESGQFWRITSRALQDVVLVRLGALVDPKEDVVSVPNFLRLIKQQVDPNKSVLATTQSSLDALKIDDDIKTVDKDQSVIHKVRKLRNKIVAHRDMSVVVRDALHELPTLPDVDIEALLTVLYEMVGKYCSTVGVKRIALHFPGDDDYKNLFKIMRLGFCVLITEDEQPYRDFCRQIGEFLLEFSQLEHTIRAVLSSALTLPTKYSSLITGNFEYANLCGVTAAILIDQTPDKKKEIEKLYSECRTLGTHRNALAHSLLTHNMDEQRFVGVNQSRQSLTPRDLFANDELQRFTAQAQSLMQRVIGFNNLAT
jgi:hypothetical protein